MLAAIPPLKDLFNQAGLELPDFLSGTGKVSEQPEKTHKAAPKVSKDDDGNDEKGK